MIPVEYFLGSVFICLALTYSVTHLLLREIRALTRALIANNSPKDLAMLEKVAQAPSMIGRSRVSPEQEGDFTDRSVRAMGL